jgi:hypothetical protein
MATKLTTLTQNMVILHQLVAEAVLLDLLSVNGEFGNFCICLHMH